MGSKPLASGLTARLLLPLSSGVAFAFESEPRLVHRWPLPSSSIDQTLFEGHHDQAEHLVKSVMGPPWVKKQWHNGRVCCTVFSHDGSLLVSGGDDGQIHIFDGRSGKCLSTSSGHQSALLSISFPIDPKEFAALYSDGTVALLDSRSGDILWSIKGIGDTPPSYLALSLDGRYLLTGCFKRIRLWDVKIRQVSAMFEESKGRIEHVAFSPDSHLLAWLIVQEDYSTTIRIHSFGLRTTTSHVHHYAGFPSFFQFSPNGGRLVLFSDNWVFGMHVVETFTGAVVSAFRSRYGRKGSKGIAPEGQYHFSFDGKWLLDASARPAVMLDTHTGEQAEDLKQIPWNLFPSYVPRYTLAECTFITGGPFQLLWSLGPTGGPIGILGLLSRFSSSLACYDNRVAFGCDDGTVTMWQVDREGPSFTPRNLRRARI